MKKRNWWLLMGIVLGIIGVAGWQVPSAQAASVKVLKKKAYSDLAMHAKTTKTAYMWDLKHSKHIHNLKNYPKTTWYLSKSYKLRIGKTTGIYYRVKNNTGKIEGLVWRDYLTKGDNPNDALAKNPLVKSYGGGLAGIKSAREAAKLQVDILALFPGTILNDQYTTDARNDLNAGINRTNNYSATNKNKQAVGIFSSYNWTKTTSKTDFVKLVKAGLENQGYTTAKRNQFKGYQIGVYATPHGYDSNYKNWLSGYGSWGIYLVPTQNALN